MADRVAAFDAKLAADERAKALEAVPPVLHPKPLPAREALSPLQQRQMDGVLSRINAKRPGKPFDQRGVVSFLSEARPYRHAPELIRDTLPLTGVAFLAGQSGAGKTFLAVELAVCLMTGTAFAGRTIDETGGVVYVAAEGAGTIEGRLSARRTRLADPDVTLPFAVVEGFGPILTPQDYEAFGLKLSAINSEMQARLGVPVKAVIIDTVAAAGMIKPDSENDPGAWQAIFDGLNPISKALGALFIPIHHHGKSADAGLRGSSNARAGADAVLALTATRDETTGDVRDHNLALVKSRSAAEGSLAQVTLEPVEIGQRPDGTPVTTLVLNFDTGIIIKSVARGRKPSKGRIALKNALEDALRDRGTKVRVHGQENAPEVKAVSYDFLADAFSRFYLTGHSSGDPKRHDAIRMALRRAIEASNDVSLGRWHETDWAWLPHGWKE